MQRYDCLRTQQNKCSIFITYICIFLIYIKATLVKNGAQRAKSELLLSDRMLERTSSL